MLNHAEHVASQRGLIVTDPELQRQIVAAAVARALGWRLELPQDREARIEHEAEMVGRP